MSGGGKGEGVKTRDSFQCPYHRSSAQMEIKSSSIFSTFFNINLSVLISTNHAWNTVYVFYRQHFIRDSYIRSVFSRERALCRDLLSTAVSIRGYLSRIRYQSEYLSPCNIARFFLVFAFRLRALYSSTIRQTAVADAPDSVARARGDSRVSGSRADFYRLIAIPRSRRLRRESRLSPSSDYARVPSSFSPNIRRVLRAQ